MSKKHHKLDLELKKLVQDGILQNNSVSITELIHLLQKGANPHGLPIKGQSSAYDIVQQNNLTGKYNFIIELFDEYSNPQENLRVSDSVEEGMSPNREFDL